MRKWISIIVFTLLIAGGAVLCAVRWQAWFGVPDEPLWTGDTLEYTFPSQITNDDDSVLTLLVLGDIHNNLTRADYDTLAARVPEADALVQTGDWMDRGQDYYYQLLLREWTESGLYGLPVMACPGNHEYSKGVNKTLSPVWQKAFLSDSLLAIHPLTIVPGVSYYVDLPSLRLIALDTNPLWRLVHLTRTLTWLHEAMNTADGRYIVVIMHHPVLSPAKGRFNTLLYAAFRYALGQADLVISGHDHSYMRRAPFVVLNTAGRPNPQRLRFPAEVTDSVPVYGVLTIDQSTISNHQSPMDFRVYRLDNGEILDSLYVTHD